MAHNDEQKYKEGHYLLEKERLVKVWMLFSSVSKCVSARLHQTVHCECLPTVMYGSRKDGSSTDQEGKTPCSLSSGGGSMKNPASCRQMDHLACQPAFTLEPDWPETTIQETSMHEVEQDCELEYCSDVVLQNSSHCVASRDSMRVCARTGTFMWLAATSRTTSRTACWIIS